MQDRSFTKTGDIVTIVDNLTRISYMFSTEYKMLSVVAFDKEEQPQYIIDGIEAFILFMKIAKSCTDEVGRSMVFKTIGAESHKVEETDMVTFNMNHACHAISLTSGDYYHYTTHPNALIMFTLNTMFGSSESYKGDKATDMWVSLAVTVDNEVARNDMLLLVAENSYADMVAEREKKIKNAKSAEMSAIINDTNNIFF